MLDFLGRHWRDLLDVLILSGLFYYLLRFIRGTRAAQMFVGLLIILLISFLAGALQLNGLNWLVSSLKTVWVLAFLILFQPELRKALTDLGGGKIWGTFRRTQETSILRELIQAVESLAEKRMGALIVLERGDPMAGIAETGSKLDARVSSELLVTIFTPSPLHDGAVVIAGDQILAAGCILPLSSREELAYAFGTRHRAALGMSEETDAVVIVVSEETGQISIAERSRLTRSLDEGTLRSKLADLFVSGGEDEEGEEDEESTASPEMAHP